MSAERADRIRAQERRARAERRLRTGPAEPDEPAQPADPPKPAERPRRAEGIGRRESPPRRRSQGSDLFARVLVAIPLAFIAIVFVDLGGAAWMGLMAVISVLCMMELYRMLDRWRPAALVGYGSAVALVIAARYGGEQTMLEVAMASVPVTFLAVAIEGRQNMPTVAIAGTLLGIVWIGLGFGHAELLRQLPHGNSIVIDVMLGTFLADTGAYVGGRIFGHRPLAPAISPNKTVEGLCLGMFTAVLTVFIAGRFQQTWLTEGQSLLLGLTIAVLGPIGDLFESVVKRDAGAKDAGTLFGAHGGALDRLDAVIFTVVGGYYVWIGLLH
ncbi:MAG TPA: phosphatidate cytidylyltransferase [Solirubrobacteraceae bacterium]|nr:phosphatidate cytidylyltransferase [Solirubrobacteraceae bacterium]